MLPITLDPYFDAVLRDHAVAAARRLGIPLENLESACEDPVNALLFLQACGDDVYAAYMDDASAAVDHVGWILVDRETGRELPERLPRRSTL